MHSIAFVTVTLSLVFLLVAQISVQYFHTYNRHPSSSLRTNDTFDRLLQENGFFVLIKANELLTSGNSRSSVPDGVSLTLEKDGNLAVYKGTTLLWETGKTSSFGDYYVTLQRGDGNFIVRQGTTANNGPVLWKTQKVVGQKDDFFFALSSDLKKVSVNQGVPSNVIKVLWSMDTLSTSMPMPTPAPTPSPTPRTTIQQTRPPTNIPTNQPTSRSTPNPTPPSVSKFNIRLMNMGEPTNFDSLFDAAKRRWESIIINDLPGISGKSGTFDWFGVFFKGQSGKSFQGAVDDVVIGYAVERIDGRGSILGSAGPRYVRAKTKTTISGIMRFDKDDFAQMGNESAMVIILHEMGHVLGLVGSLGGSGCQGQCDRSVARNKGSPYSCEKAKAEYANMKLDGKGQDDLLLNRRGGRGSRCAHWDDASFQHHSASELMTAFFVEEKKQLITRATLGALEDIDPQNGYKCDYSKADKFPINNDDIVLVNSDMMYSLVPHANFTIEDRMESFGEPEQIDEF